MSAVTTHILDTSCGRPAAGVPVILERKSAESRWQTIASGTTDSDGRLKDLLPADEEFLSGQYRLTFDTASYFTERDIECFFPQVAIAFVIRDPKQHYHVPLLLSPFGYSTYRGS